MEIALKQAHTRTRGFSLMELLIAIAISAILMAIGLPPFLQWREGLRYREASNGIVAALRTARSTAISSNKQVELELSGTAYRIRSGNRAMASTDWNATSWVSVTTGIGLNTANSRIIVNPNGTLFFTNDVSDPVYTSTSAALTVSILNSNVSPAVNKYNIVLSQTGRISATPIH